VVEYGYDSVSRLVTIERKADAATPGERTVYTLDGVGNRTREERQLWTGSAWANDSSTDYVYSSRCHLDKVIHPDGTATEYAYDCEGNLERVWDANHPSGNQTNAATETYIYDALNRITSVAQPWGGSGGGTAVTSYGYDVGGGYADRGGRLQLPRADRPGHGPPGPSPGRGAADGPARDEEVGMKRRKKIAASW